MARRRALGPRGRALALAALGALGLVAPAGAQAPPPELPVRVVVTVGFGDALPPGWFAGVQVDLENRGAGARVEVEVALDDAATPALVLGPVELEAGERRRLTGVVAATDLDGAEVVARARVPGDRLVGEGRTTIDALTGQLLVVLDRRGAPPADLSALRTQARGGDIRWGSKVLSRGEDLPTSPLAWSGVGAVLLGELDVEGWPEPAARALAAWVHRGGHLVVATGDRARRLRRSLLGRRLGAALEALPDAAPDRDVDLSALAARFASEDEPPRGATAPAVAPLVPAPALDEVVLRGGGRALGARRRHGLGLVTVLAFDPWQPPVLHAPWFADLLGEVVRDGTQHQPRARHLFRQLSQIRQPARTGGAFAVLILYALILGPGVYFLLRSRRRGLLLWVVIPAGSLLTTALVPLLPLVLRGAESTLVGVRVLELRPGVAHAAETTDVLLFSGNLEPMRVAHDGEDAAAFSVSPSTRLRRADARVGQVLGGGPDGARFQLPVALWGSRYVSVEATAPAPDVEASVALSRVFGEDGPGQVRLRVRNGAPYALRGVQVAVPTSVGIERFTLERPLAPGAEVSQTFEAAVGQGGLRGERDLSGLILEGVLVPFCDERLAVEGAGRAYLLAAADAPVPLTAAPNVQQRAFPTLLMLALDVEFEGVVPATVGSTQVDVATVAAVASNAVGREVTTTITLPGGGRGAGRVRLQVDARRSRALERLALQVWEWQLGRWEDVPPASEEPELEGRAGPRRIKLELPPGAWVSQEGALRVRQRFERDPREDDRVWRVDVRAEVERTAAPAESP